MLVADALRLGGAILSVFPDMLAPQLVGRLLPEIGTNPNVKMLLNQCDKVGPDHCALLPFYHSLHTPGGPLKVGCIQQGLYNIVTRVIRWPSQGLYNTGIHTQGDFKLACRIFHPYHPKLSYIVTIKHILT